MTQRIGIYGGSFNPIHKGHVYFAEKAKRELYLDRIIIIPSNVTPLKDTEAFADNNHRLNMCRLAVNGLKGFEVSDYEISSGGISYTLNTVKHFRKIFSDAELYLLVGSDAMLSFKKWYHYEEILETVTLAVSSREENDRISLQIYLDDFVYFNKIVLLKSDYYPSSSTEIRRKIKNKEDLSCYLNENVVQYIALNKLYEE